MKKYILTFNCDNKKIVLYNPNIGKKSKDNNKFFIFLIIIRFNLFFISDFILGK